MTKNVKYKFGLQEGILKVGGSSDMPKEALIMMARLTLASLYPEKDTSKASFEFVTIKKKQEVIEESIPFDFFTA